MTSFGNKAVFLLLLSTFLLVVSVGCTSSSGGSKNPFSVFQSGKKTPAPKKVDQEFKTMGDFLAAPRPEF